MSDATDPIQGLNDYATQHTTPLDPLIEELIAETHAELAGRAGMLSGATVGTLLQFLVASSGAKRVLEVGMFTGVSALMMAAGLPDDGELFTCDISARHIAFGKRYFERSPHGRIVIDRVLQCLLERKRLRLAHLRVDFCGERESKKDRHYTRTAWAHRYDTR